MIALVLGLAFACAQDPAQGGELARALLADARAWTAAAVAPPLEDVRALEAEAARLGDPELLRAIGNLGHRLGELGERAAAREVVGWTAARAQELGVLATQAWALDWLAQEAWVRGTLDEAAEFLERAALVEAERDAPAEGARHLADVARLRLTQGRLDEALAAAERATECARADPSGAASRRAAEVRGEILFELGRHREALELALAHGGGAVQDETQVRLDILASDVLADVGRLDSALIYARRAHASALQPAVLCVAPLLQLETELDLGLLLGDVGRTEEALALLDAAAREFERLGDARGSAWAAKNRGFALFAAGRQAEAVAPLERAWRAGAELGVPFLEGFGALGVAEALVYGGNAQDARVEAALVVAERVAHERHERQLDWRAAALRGRLALARGAYEPALDQLTHATRLIERWRRRLGAGGLIEHALRARSDPYRDAAFAAARLGRGETALAFAEQLEARVLDELCARDEAPLELGAPQVEALRERIGRLEYVTRESGVGADELARAEDELDATQLALELASGRTLVSSSAGLALETLRAGMRAQAIDVALTYLVGPEETLVLCVEAQGTEVGCVWLAPGRARIRALIERLRAPPERLEAGELDLAHLGFDVRAARELYDGLVRPLALADGERVALLRDDVLAAIPFELFVSAGELGRFDAERPFAHLADLAYFGDEHALASYGSLARLAQVPRPRPPGCRVLLAQDGQGLPSARAEAAAIERVMGGAVLVAARAASDLLPGGVGLVHVAVHGRVDGARPAHGYLQLGSGANATRFEAWQAAELALDDATVVLSACHSGRGEWRAGAGLAGLLRGFLLGGAREVVASAWAVEDGATARFMELFYGSLARGNDAAEALRQARVALRHESDARGFALAHPSFWAGWFVQR